LNIVSQLTDKLSVVGLALDQLINTANTDPQNSFNVREVWYSIDSGVPETPAVLIEPQNSPRELQETGFTTINRFTVHFTVLHSRLSSETETSKECLDLAEQLEDVLHSDRRLGGIIVHSYVTSIELGVATRQRTTLRAARLVWQGWSKTRLGPQ